MTSANLTIVVPLAGPDFDLPSGETKATTPLNGSPLLRAALESRPWWVSGQAEQNNLVFVLRTTAASAQFEAEHLRGWYPGAKVVWLSHFSGGAALSAGAGLSLVADSQRPVCIDLADILYQSDFDPVAAFAAKPDLGGACLTFPSDSPAYSYLEERDGVVVRAAEKRVISQRASAGTYFFRSPSVYLDALSRSLAAPEQAKHRGLFFVCPLMNGVISAGSAVTCHDVTDVFDLKTTG